MCDFIFVNMDSKLFYVVVFLLVDWGKVGAENNVSAADEIRNNSLLSSPDECARSCKIGETPKICYNHYKLEPFTVMGPACKICTPNATNNATRSMQSVNRMLPGPSIQVCEGDKVVIDVEDYMEGMEVTIRWHGLWQNGTQYYDGMPSVSQLPIQQGNTSRYQWLAGNAGTYFWHADTSLHRMDGIYGSIVVRQPPAKDPNSNLYDFDLTNHVILLSDWMHEDAAEIFPGRLAVNTAQDPESLLINGKSQFQDPNTGITTNTLEIFTITAEKRYRFRMINSFATICPAHLTIQRHKLKIIATDGKPVHPMNVDTIISHSGERYDFVINADKPVGAYWIQLRGLGECGVRRMQQLAILRYDGAPDEPSTSPPTYDLGLPQGVVLNPLDARCDKPRADAICVSQLENAEEIDQGILAEPDVKIVLPFKFPVYTADDIFDLNFYNKHLVAPNGDQVFGLIGEISNTAASAPLISQYDNIEPEQFCKCDNESADCEQNCMFTHKVEIPLDSVIEVVLIDEVPQPNVSQSFHLHGYSFNVIGIGRLPDRNVTKIDPSHAVDFDRLDLQQRQSNLPPGKDTIAVPNNGYVVLRFRADNPGFWLFRCHFLLHTVRGLNLVFQIGSPSDLPVLPDSSTAGDDLPKKDNKFN